VNFNDDRVVQYSGMPRKKKKLTMAELRKKWQKGGKKRAKNLTPEQRSESSSKAAQARWNK
jgi:hypothetical protein